MASTVSGIRRLLAGREVGIALGLLLVGSVLLQGRFLPAYLAILLASGVRNVYLAWLGNGVPFWTVAIVGLYIQAVTVTASYLAVRTLVTSLRSTPPDESST